MGLGFYVKDYDCKCSFSYSGFNEFRKKIARSIGIDLEEMQGFIKQHPDDPEFIKAGWRDWEDIKSPIKHLLNHSDCDGKISHSSCMLMSTILKSIVYNWEIVDGYDYDKVKGFALVEAMEHCAHFKKDLEFC
jgi:hypothetical protein